MAMTELRFGLASCALVLALSLPAQTRAAAPPGEFRSEFVGALASCTAAFNALAHNYERGSSDEEMRSAARGLEQNARDLLIQWSQLSRMDASQLTMSASVDLRTNGIESREKLLDLASYCENRIADFLGTANARGYIP
jgi:hypothetical protein